MTTQREANSGNQTIEQLKKLFSEIGADTEQLYAFLRNREKFLNEWGKEGEPLNKLAKALVSLDLFRFNHHFSLQASNQLGSDRRIQSLASEAGHKELAVSHGEVIAKHSDGSPFCNGVTIQATAAQKPDASTRIEFKFDTVWKEACEPLPTDLASADSMEEPLTTSVVFMLAYDSSRDVEGNGRNGVQFLGDSCVTLGPQLPLTVVQSEDPHHPVGETIYVAGYMDATTGNLSLKFQEHDDATTAQA